MKLTKPFHAVPPGEIYPIEYAAGDECPAEYEQSAIAQGCLAENSKATCQAPARKARGGASRSSSASAKR